ERICQFACLRAGQGVCRSGRVATASAQWRLATSMRGDTDPGVVPGKSVSLSQHFSFALGQQRFLFDALALLSGRGRGAQRRGPLLLGCLSTRGGGFFPAQPGIENGGQWLHGILVPRRSSNRVMPVFGLKGPRWL